MNKEAIDAAIEELEKFLEVAAVDPAASGPWPNTIRPFDEVAAQARVACKVLDIVMPEWQSEFSRDLVSGPFDRERRVAKHAIAALRAEHNLQALVQRDIPQLAANRLHAWVWEAARSQWESGHFRDAVSAAARLVSNRTQQKVDRRDKSEWVLIQESFSVKSPEAGKPRLRLTQDDGGDTFKNLHDGAGFLAQGLFRGIRNPSNHDVLPELTENEALEQLAAFSLLARWIDQAQVIRAD